MVCKSIHLFARCMQEYVLHSIALQEICKIVRTYQKMQDILCLDLAIARDLQDLVYLASSLHILASPF